MSFTNRPCAASWLSSRHVLPGVSAPGYFLPSLRDSAKAPRTFTITISTEISLMQYGSQHRIFGRVDSHGYIKHGEQALAGFTTSSRLPNGQTRSGSAGAKSVTARVPTAAARWARPLSVPTYNFARCKIEAPIPSDPERETTVKPEASAPDWNLNVISLPVPRSSGPSNKTTRNFASRISSPISKA